MERWLRLGSPLVLTLGLCASPALAQTESAAANVVRPVRFDQAPLIDGRIDEAVWGLALGIDPIRLNPVRVEEDVVRASPDARGAPH